MTRDTPRGRERGTVRGIAEGGRDSRGRECPRRGRDRYLRGDGWKLQKARIGRREMSLEAPEAYKLATASIGADDKKNQDTFNRDGRRAIREEEMKEGSELPHR
ncbi:hypothetical protein ACLOJK_023168 [Asimina triloba]